MTDADLYSQIAEMRSDLRGLSDLISEKLVNQQSNLTRVEANSEKVHADMLDRMTVLEERQTELDRRWQRIYGAAIALGSVSGFAGAWAGKLLEIG